MVRWIQISFWCLSDQTCFFYHFLVRNVTFRYEFKRSSFPPVNSYAQVPSRLVRWNIFHNFSPESASCHRYETRFCRWNLKSAVNKSKHVAWRRTGLLPPGQPGTRIESTKTSSGPWETSWDKCIAINEMMWLRWEKGLKGEGTQMLQGLHEITVSNTNKFIMVT
jgi:hypothetical protein